MEKGSGEMLGRRQHVSRRSIRRFWEKSVWKFIIQVDIERPLTSVRGRGKGVSNGETV